MLKSTSSSLSLLVLSPRQPQSWAESAGKQAAEREGKKICSVEIFLCPFNMCYIPLATRHIICDHTLSCSVWLVGWNNYSTYTYFQLWTKCRAWSRSKPAENAAERKLNNFSVNANSHKSNISVTRLKTNKQKLFNLVFSESTEHWSDAFKEIVEKFLFFSN